MKTVPSTNWCFPNLVPASIGIPLLVSFRIERCHTLDSYGREIPYSKYGVERIYTVTSIPITNKIVSCDSNPIPVHNWSYGVINDINIVDVNIL